MKVKVKKVKEKSVLKTIKVNREDFLQKLEEVSPGLATGKEIIEQAASYLFRKGYLYTFNDEIMCKTKSGLPDDFVGAVKAKKFLEMVRSYPDPVIGITFGNKEVTITGKGKKTDFPLETELSLQVQVVERPEEWKDLHEDFTDAVSIVRECASKNQTAFTLTCVHIHPKWMEAFDNTQLTRYRLPTGVSKPFLVKREAIKYVPGYDFIEMAETKNWIHFRTKSKMVMSLHRYVAEASDYQNLTDILKITGAPVVLPKALGGAAKRAASISVDNDQGDLALVEVTSGRLKISASANGTKHTEVKKLKYDGPDMTFSIAPNLLIELMKRHTECEISDTYKLKVNGGKFKYVACLRKL